MILSIANRVSVAIGVLLLLFFLSIALLFYLTKRIDESAAYVALADMPRQDAVLEMELGLAATARAVAAYAVDGAPSDKQEARESENAFERAAGTLNRLAITAEEGRLGAQVVERFEDIKRLGAEIVVTADSERVAIAPLRRGMAAVRELVAGQVRRSLAQGVYGAAGKLEVLLGVDATFDETFAAFVSYRALPDPGARETVRDAAVAFQRLAERYRAQGLSADEEAWLGKLGAEFTATIRIGNEVLALVDRKRGMLVDLDIERERLHDLLDSQLAPLIRATRPSPDRDLSFSTYTIILYLLLMSVFFVGSGAAMLLTRGIVRPLDELTAGAEAIGRGVLDHRIAIESKDEIGKLADSFNRMAENRQQAENALRDLAHRDVLTKLPNRALFHSRLIEALDTARRIDRMAAVYFLDLDHFKDINDTLGHPAGDILLQKVATRIEGCLRKSDTVARIETETVARLGGDEFAIIQTNILYSNGIAVLAKRLIEALAKPFDLDGEQVFTGCSIGITVFPNDGTETEQLLKNADLALYRAKQEGRNTYRLFDPEMNAAIQMRRALERDLRQALERGDIYLEYQPQIEIASGRIVGAEALVRWHHPERGMVAPSDFVPVAEQSGLISQLTEMVLSEACAQAKAWHDRGLPPLRVSVNLCAADFKRRDLVTLTTRVIQDTGVDPGCLELEITESMMMSDASAVVVTLQDLKALGIGLAIDDFGTGFSSMNYLKQFPVDRLKIDRAFVRDIVTSKADAGITKAIIKLGHSLGMEVVAEGVETEVQLEFLRLRACDAAQGYLFSRPIGPEAFEAFVRGHTSDDLRAVSEIA